MKSSRSACTLILSSNKAFLNFWNSETCRNTLLSLLSSSDLSTLRLVCHGMSENIAAHAFEALTITFRARTFTKPARLAALARIGRHVKTLTFCVSRTLDTMVPPLINPWSGEQRAFVWKPQVKSCRDGSGSCSRYGDRETMDLLVRQYPPLFHAAADVQSFVSAIACLTNLEHLKVSCTGHGGSAQGGTDIVDYALTSLRIAVEHARLRHLSSLTLSHIRQKDIMSLSPLAGAGAQPGSTRTWSRVRCLEITMYSSPAQHDQIKLQREYIRGFNSLERFSFCWVGARGSSPLPPPKPPLSDVEVRRRHPALRTSAGSDGATFPRLTHFAIINATMRASQVEALIRSHRHTLRELTFEDVILQNGTWYDALGVLERIDVKGKICVEEDLEATSNGPASRSSEELKTLSRRREQLRNQVLQQSNTPDTVRKILLVEEMYNAQGRGRDNEQKVERNWCPGKHLRERCVDMLGWRLKT